MEIMRIFRERSDLIKKPIARLILIFVSILIICVLISKLVVLAGISFYQEFISPFKGYRCAYAVYYHDISCSSYLKKMVKEKGIIKGWRLFQKRRALCDSAAIKIQCGEEERERPFSARECLGCDDEKSFYGQCSKSCDGLFGLCDVGGCSLLNNKSP